MLFISLCENAKCQNEKRMKNKVTDFVFLGSKITADGDCTPQN